MKLFVKQKIINKLRKRNKFRREYTRQTRYWREHPLEFIEKFLGCKLHWYQKVLLKMQDKLQNRFVLIPYRIGRNNVNDITHTLYKILAYK